MRNDRDAMIDRCRDAIAILRNIGNDAVADFSTALLRDIVTSGPMWRLYGGFVDQVTEYAANANVSREIRDDDCY